MNITIEELEKLETGTFDVIDMRGETEIAHGAIPGSVAIPEQELLENPPENTGKKLIIVCSRGRVSVDVSEELCGRGYEAYSLEGGYIGWLMSEMKKQEAEEICESVEKSIRKKFHKSIWSNFTKAVRQYELVKEGDRVAVGVSGGKDSLALLVALTQLSRFYPEKFEVVAITLEMGYDEMDFSPVQALCDSLGVEYIRIPTQIGPIIFDIRHEENPCALCAKMRRGALHEAAKAAGCNKVALGHHFDDVVETYMLSLFYEGRISCFQPVTYLDRADITLIRPLLYVPEYFVRSFAKRHELPIVHNPCPADGNTKRQEIKELLTSLEKTMPGLRDRIFGAMQRYPLDGWEPDRTRRPKKPKDE